MSDKHTKRKKDSKRVREAKRIQHADTFREGFDHGFQLGLQVGYKQVKEGELLQHEK